MVILKILCNRANNTEKAIIHYDLSTGSEKFMQKDAVFMEGDLSDPVIQEHIFTAYPILAVIYFATLSLIGSR